MPLTNWMYSSYADCAKRKLNVLHLLFAPALSWQETSIDNAMINSKKGPLASMQENRNSMWRKVVFLSSKASAGKQEMQNPVSFSNTGRY